ncbi:MAG: hypothetical protein J6Y90_07450 [Lachnospiraceae bacterium]|nr:hypothetical protein [Lachnospiraceae bacterium]
MDIKSFTLLPCSYEDILYEIEEVWHKETMIAGLNILMESIRVSYLAGTITEEQSYDLIFKVLGLKN